MNGRSRLNSLLRAVLLAALLVVGSAPAAEAQLILQFGLDFDECDPGLTPGPASLEIDFDVDDLIVNPVGPFTHYVDFDGTVELPGGEVITPSFFGMLVETTNVDAIRIQGADGDPFDPDFLISLDLVLPPGTLDDQSIPDAASISDLIAEATAADAVVVKRIGSERPSCTGTIVSGGEDPDPGNEPTCNGFSAGDKVKVGKEATILGSLHANGAIKLKGDGTAVDGSLASVTEINLGGENVVTGSVTAQEIKVGSAEVEGGIFELPGGGVQLPPVPPVTPGEEVIKVPKDGVLQVPPGAYFDVKVKPGGELGLTGGLYQFRKLLLAKNATLTINGPEPVVALIQKKFLMAKNARVVDADPEDLEINVEGTNAAVLATESSFVGTIVAPSATVKVGKETHVIGDICAKNIIIGNDAEITSSEYDESCDITNVTVSEAPSCNPDGTHDLCLLVSGTGLTLPPPGLKIVIDGLEYPASGVTAAAGGQREICIDDIDSPGEPNVFVQWADGCTYYFQDLYTAPSCP